MQNQESVVILMVIALLLNTITKLMPSVTKVLKQAKPFIIKISIRSGESTKK